MFLFPTHLYLLPTIVDGPGQYMTRRGETVTVEQLVGPGIMTARAYGTYQDGVRESWYSCGRVLAHYQSPHDIVQKA